MTLYPLFLHKWAKDVTAPTPDTMFAGTLETSDDRPQNRADGTVRGRRDDRAGVRVTAEAVGVMLRLLLVVLLAGLRPTGPAHAMPPAPVVVICSSATAAAKTTLPAHSDAPVHDAMWCSACQLSPAVLLPVTTDAGASRAAACVSPTRPLHIATAPPPAARRADRPTGPPANPV